MQSSCSWPHCSRDVACSVSGRRHVAHRTGELGDLWLEWLAGGKHSFAREPRMNLRLHHSRLDRWIILRELGSLLGADTEDFHAAEFSRIVEREVSGERHFSLVNHLLDESTMLLEYLVELRPTWIPFLRAVHKDHGVLFQALAVGRSVNCAGIDKPRP